MVAKLPKFIFSALTVAVLLSIPAASWAQSTFVVPFDRSGMPGTTTIEILDPLTGNLVSTSVATGAFENPCTLENVDVSGSSAISSLVTVDKFGNRKVSVSTITKGTGMGWISPDGVNRVFSGSNYSFNESQQFTFRLPPAGGEEFSSDFSDKLTMRGAKSIDNWSVRAHFRIKINSVGEVQVLLMKMTGDSCKG